MPRPPGGFADDADPVACRRIIASLLVVVSLILLDAYYRLKANYGTLPCPSLRPPVLCIQLQSIITIRIFVLINIFFVLLTY